MRDGRAVQIFLSYRRGDVGGYAGRLTDALLPRLGPKSVFQDVTAITPGQDFTAAIDHALDDCDAVLAMIGPGWLVTAVVAVVLVGLGAAAWWWGPGTGEQAGSQNDIAPCAPPNGQDWNRVLLNKDPTGEEKVEGGSLVFKVKAAYWRAHVGA